MRKNANLASQTYFYPRPGPFRCSTAANCLPLSPPPASTPSRLASAQDAPLLTRPIPSSGQQIPMVGSGSWRTFNVGNDPEARDACAEVMRAFFACGGRMIDSSPMYGSSQDTIGYGLKKLDAVDKVFSADKVWT
jgi:hypothetical protein